MKIKLLLITTFLTICGNLQAASCETTTSITYITPEFNVPYIPYGSPALSGNGPQNILTCSDRIYTSSYFQANFDFSSDSPFNMPAEVFNIEGSPISDPAILNEAKQYLSQNFLFEFELKDNSGGSTTVKVSDTQHNFYILPATANSPGNVIQNNDGELYYTGEEGNGILSFGMIIPRILFSLNSIQPSSEALTALNHTTLSFRLGTLFTSYYDAADGASGIAKTQATQVYIRIPISFDVSTCFIDVPSELNLGSTTSSQLGINGSANKKSFGLNIFCNPAPPPGTRLKLTVQDSANVSNFNREGLLSNSSSDSEKSNAVIQLINDITGRPFPIGDVTDYLPVDGNTTTFQKTASAQIYNATPPATAGKVEGKATFLIDYE